MAEQRTVSIRRDLDVMYARSCVRDAARQVGMNTMDQALIALATSTAARCLGLGDPYPGKIAIGTLNGGDRTGVQIHCTIEDRAHPGISAETLTKARSMADELTVSSEPNSLIQVTLIKWAK